MKNLRNINNNSFWNDVIGCFIFLYFSPKIRGLIIRDLVATEISQVSGNGNIYEAVGGTMVFLAGVGVAVGLAPEAAAVVGIVAGAEAFGISVNMGAIGAFMMGMC